jgi:probable phosphoglycerate mutase
VSTPTADALGRATLYGHADLELILVRHGQQLALEDRSPDQLTDPPLSAIGSRQIGAVADHLAGESIDAVYSSRLVRAHDTGLAIAARHGLDLTVIEDLREVKIGKVIPDADESAADRADWVAAADEFVRTGRWGALPGTESSNIFRARISSAMQSVIERHPTGRVVVACHSGVINAFVAEVLGIERDFWFRTAHCSVNRMLVGDGGRVAVQNLNETHYMVGDISTA